MGNYLKVYTGAVTSGAQDGTEISSEHTMTNPISVLLDSSIAESKFVKCAVRCDTGYTTDGITTIGFTYWDGTEYQTTGGAIDKFKVALDNGYTEADVDENATWADSVNISDKIEDKNVLFWVKISSTKDEAPAKDISIALTVKGVLVTVEG